MCKSDLIVLKVEVKAGFEEIVKDLCAVQAARDESRKLVSCFPLSNDEKTELVLFFELA